MTYFTAENTEGFTDADLTVLNRAHTIVLAMQDEIAGGDSDDYGCGDNGEIAESLGDSLTNAWQPGDTSDDLIGRIDRSWISR